MENQKLKDWCYRELETSKRFSKTREDMLKSCTFCLGAVQYAQTVGLVTYEEVCEWWDELREQFWYGPFGETEA